MEADMVAGQTNEDTKDAQKSDENRARAFEASEAARPFAVKVDDSVRSFTSIHWIAVTLVILLGAVSAFYAACHLSGAR